MQIKAHESCKGLADFANMTLERDSSLRRATEDCELTIGPASAAGYGTPAHAKDAIFVGDEAWVDKVPDIDAATEALFQADPTKVLMRPRWDSTKKKFVMNYQSAGDAIDPIAGQLFSPWNISYMAKMFREPLGYSKVDEYVSYDAGNNPWAELYTLFLEKYAGGAMVGKTGSLQNNQTADVNVRDGMMSATVINISGTYSLTLEEQTRGGSNPFGESSMTSKQAYLNYVINMLKARIALYGNADTQTDGYLTINPAQPSPITLKNIVNGTSTTKGSDIYEGLAAILNDYLTSSDNKFQTIQMIMSPEAWNYLMSTAYSKVYDPRAAMRIFTENYLAGKGPGGSTPSISFIVEPLLKANSAFNPLKSDYLIMNCPRVAAGPTAIEQETSVFGAPLQKFVFPAIPGMYSTQYKTLARLAGLIAPVPSAIRVYEGFGVAA